MKHLKLFNTDVDYQTFISGYIDLPNVSFAIDIEKVYYNAEPEPKNYLTIEALEDGLTASLSVNACEYCIDEDGDWKTLSADTPTESINAGQTLSFRGNLIPNSDDGIGTFTISKKCNVLGNVMSMLFGDNGKDSFSLSGKDYAFYSLFYDCSNIISAKDLYLPATTLANYCYYGMFNGCSLLKTAPELPATTLAEYCYGYMFCGCTSLTTAPELPATLLAWFCYSSMFDNCTSLTEAPVLPATTLDVGCYINMFYGCTKLQVVTKSEFIAFNGYTDSSFEGTLKDCYMPKNQNVIINLSDSDEVIFNYSGGIYSALREEIILSDILSQEDISTLTPEYDLIVTVYDNYPDPHIVNTPNICEHITWEAGQSLEEFAENFNFDYNHTSISILYTSRKGGDYYYYYD